MSQQAASGLEVEVPLPRYVQRVHCDTDGRFPPGQQAWEYAEKSHTLRWRFKKLQGAIWCARVSALCRRQLQFASA